MIKRTYIKINMKEPVGDSNEFCIVYEELLQIPQIGSRLEVYVTENGTKIDAHFMSSKVEIVTAPPMYEQTFFYNEYR